MTQKILQQNRRRSHSREPQARMKSVERDSEAAVPVKRGRGRPRKDENTRMDIDSSRPRGKTPVRPYGTNTREVPVANRRSVEPQSSFGNSGAQRNQAFPNTRPQRPSGRSMQRYSPGPPSSNWKNSRRSVEPAATVRPQVVQSRRTPEPQRPPPIPETRTISDN